MTCLTPGFGQTLAFSALHSTLQHNKIESKNFLPKTDKVLFVRRFACNNKMFLYAIGLV